MYQEAADLYRSLIRQMLPGSSPARQVLAVRLATPDMPELTIRLSQEPSVALRTGGGPDDVAVETGDYIKVPRVFYTVDVPYQSDDAQSITGAIIKRLADKEQQILLPVLNEAMNASGQIMGCPSWADPYQIMATEAVQMLKANKFTCGNIISIDKSRCVLCSSKNDLGAFIVFDEWTIVSFTSDTITLTGVFGCIVRPHALVGIVRQKAIS